MAQVARAACPHCSYSAPIPDNAAGQAVRCPRCGQLFRAPAPAPARRVERWFVQRDDKQVGPYALEALQQLATAGELKADAWLIMTDTDACVLAATIPGLVFRARRANQRTTGARPAASKRPTATAPPSPAPAPKPVGVAVECPACRAPCQVPKPQTPTVFNCPRCKRPFRAACTSVGVVVRRVDPSSARGG